LYVAQLSTPSLAEHKVDLGVFHDPGDSSSLATSMAALVANVFGILNAPFAAAKSKAVPPKIMTIQG
jgi:hypothetical protein